MKLPDKLHKKIAERKAKNAFRKLGLNTDLIDFSSNDYLGFSKSKTIFENTHQYMLDTGICENGATGSRLLSGNYSLYAQVEQELSFYHNSEAALLFNSGYSANVGFFSAVLQKGDVIFYDEFIHASIRDGVQLSHASSYKFRHNDLQDLAKRIANIKGSLKYANATLYVVTESVFSMDGDTPDLQKIAAICRENSAYLIVDEAHALGVFGQNGLGLVQKLELEEKVFARIATFGKALGCHGAVVLGSKELISFLVNFSRSFIYTTGISPHALATIKIAYQFLRGAEGVQEMQKLRCNIQHFNSEVARLGLSFIPSASAIQCTVIQGTTHTKK
ncbi:aminotransferase class I/II-fold pyridoxal phosphate-dependent enzyme [Tenacibaculum sp. SG-28]|uniref:aminotransferase class I/II-fold pyridoxal phosphate-dependent enzyme n=1 Tax=Tenacibaculum sp. SG-28 TaxID=754426 RepID=UPI0035136AFC